MEPGLRTAGDEPDSSAESDDKRRELWERIEEAVRGVEPDAEIILYGSRARGDARPDSDWDLLILIDGALDRDREDAICRRLYEVELSSAEVICPMLLSRQDWDSPRYRATPFHHNVVREGIVLSRFPSALSRPEPTGSEAASAAAAGKTFRELRQRIKETVHTVDPDAEVILYGSRARGDARPDSGWDLLILVNGLVDDEKENAICRQLYEIEWSSGEVLCPMIFSLREWTSAQYRVMPFHQIVNREGVVL